ncbi:hypothetical protein EDD21DRAFT_384252 [Dissophora ornata]|nr:hypothetical protein EDD21DRAFT_384252 [Dissophora ornata]
MPYLTCSMSPAFCLRFRLSVPFVWFCLAENLTLELDLRFWATRALISSVDIGPEDFVALLRVDPATEPATLGLISRYALKSRLLI